MFIIINIIIICKSMIYWMSCVVCRIVMFLKMNLTIYSFISIQNILKACYFTKIVFHYFICIGTCHSCNIQGGKINLGRYYISFYRHLKFKKHHLPKLHFKFIICYNNSHQNSNHYNILDLQYLYFWSV